MTEEMLNDLLELVDAHRKSKNLFDSSTYLRFMGLKEDFISKYINRKAKYLI